MTPEQWHGVGTCAGIIGIGGFVVLVGAALLLQTDRAITRLKAERVAYRVDRERRRADVAQARSWHDVYGGDE